MSISSKSIEFIHNDSLSNAINALRMVKDDEEIDCIRKAQEIAEKALRGASALHQRRALPSVR